MTVDVLRFTGTSQYLNRRAERLYEGLDEGSLGGNGPSMGDDFHRKVIAHPDGNRSCGARAVGDRTGRCGVMLAAERTDITPCRVGKRSRWT